MLDCYLFKRIRTIFGALLHALDEGAEGFHLRTKEQVAKLSVCKEHDEEHNGESHDVFGTAAQSRRQLSHSLIETDVLENLEARTGGVKLWAPTTMKLNAFKY